MLRQAARSLRSLRTQCVTDRGNGRLLPASRKYATVTDVDNFPKVHSSVHGFRMHRIKHVPELHLTALELEHEKTGAQYLHVARDDTNNLFAINFKTNPNDDTGVPHILEHVTLCGSEKYPVRDPFFKMMPRSLANFMNAYTSADYTSYPFATTNKQDFQNLLSVYLDATLHPLLKHSDFLQEGWRLGPENPQSGGQSGDVLFKGVVYNEMKGQMSDASYLFYVRHRDHMFPAIHNSGGDPEKMTDLTYDDLVEFHRRNYHPSNAKIFSYGDLQLDNQLERVGAILDRFTKSSRDTEKRTPLDVSNGPFEFTVEGPVDTMQNIDKQSKSSVSWLASKTSDIVETFSLGVLSSLLLEGYGSPMYRALIESGLGSNFSPNTGLDTSSRMAIFSIGLDGVGRDDIPKVKETIRAVFQEFLSKGVDDAKVQGLLHQLELALKHKTASFGMGLLDRTVSGWFNGIDPLEGLAWNDIVNAFKLRYEQGGYLESLLQKYFLNDLSLTFSMHPWEDYGKDMDESELERRDAKLLQLSQESQSDRKTVIDNLEKQELALMHEQETAKVTNLDCLPSLHVRDIPRRKEFKHVREVTLDGAKVLWRETSTNGLTYFQAKHAFESLPDELRPYLPLFNDCLMRLGSRSKSMEQLEDEIKLNTGGISTSSYSRVSPTDTNQLTEGLLYTGYALDKNVPVMLDLLRQIILETDFEGPNALLFVLNLLESKTSGALDSVAEAGHSFASSFASSALSRHAYIREQVSGLSQVEHTALLTHAAQRDPDSLRAVLQKLKEIQSLAISNGPQLSVRIVCEPSSSSTNEASLAKFMSNLPQRSLTTDQGSIDALSGPVIPPNSRQTFFNLPFKVSYAAKAFRTVPYTHPESPALAVLGQLLSHNYLHPEIREKGGAYGSSAANNALSGLFTMSSYRDPNPQNSMKIIRNAGRLSADRDWIERELEEAKLGIFQHIDAPIDVNEEGEIRFMSGVTEEMEQGRREKLLDVRNADVQEVARKYLANATEGDTSTCILGEERPWVQEDDRWDVRNLQMGESAIEIAA